MKVWLWLAGKDSLLAKVEKEYSSSHLDFDKRSLKMICKSLKWDWKQWAEMEEEENESGA